MITPFMLEDHYLKFMAEQEGLLNTRESAILRIVKDVKAYPDPIIPDVVFYSICESNGISPGSLTQKELDRISHLIS